MTLAELRQIAARQQHQIESQQQLLVAKEQRLKFLRQQEACHHTYSEQHLENNCLITLRDKIEGQELKLRQLRALRSQVDQQKTSNSSLGKPYVYFFTSRFYTCCTQKIRESLESFFM